MHPKQPASASTTLINDPPGCAGVLNKAYKVRQACCNVQLSAAQCSAVNSMYRPYLTEPTSQSK